MFYTQSLVKNLREDNREIVQLYAELMAKAVINESDENLNFIFENVIKKVQFPIVQTNVEGEPLSWRNLSEDIKTSKDIKPIVGVMDRQNEPISLVYYDLKTGEEYIWGVLHFGDSQLIQRLIWLPYFEIGAITLFILLGFVGFSFIRNSEKQHIWVGMARETAHQLGTPVSALMGWVDWLRENPEKTLDIVEEMNADLNRLNQVSERFSQMGSTPKLEETDLSELVKTVVDYLEKRLPTKGKSLKLVNEITSKTNIYANITLLSWAIENIIKNGIDAITQERGEVRIRLRMEKEEVRIQIHDDGKGVEKKDLRNVFRPGFSTKNRGWGLGLSLTQRIIQDIHRGKIFIKQSSPGSGTTFEIILPT
jgi:signal transduction histidine kinase